MEKIIYLSIFLVVCFGFCFARVWFVYQKAKRLKAEQLAKKVEEAKTVVARIESQEEEKACWTCKFFWYLSANGSCRGFFKQKPKSKRVYARVVGFDSAKQLYELQEL